MDQETKDFIVDCIKQRKGDDLFRARSAFSHCTKDEMEQEYSNSGKTRREILDSYTKHEQKCDKAIEAVKTI